MKEDTRRKEVVDDENCTANYGALRGSMKETVCTTKYSALRGIEGGN